MKRLSESDIALRRKMCDGKTQHKSLLAAEYVLNQYRNDSTIGIYKCPFCKFHHLGHNKFIIKKSV